MGRMAVVMCSCDAYEDLWYPFFECFDRFWGDIPYNVYLNTEKKQYDDSGNSFKVTTLNLEKSPRGGVPWGKRFLKVLDRIEEEYVFLVLDDFFLCDKVDNAYLEQIMDIMDADKSIASFQLSGTRIRNRQPESYQVKEELTYDLIHKNGWRTHFIPTVWRKSVLKKWLRPWESIWGFEAYGSRRARKWDYPEKVYIVSHPVIYDYLWIKDCSAVVNGKWINEPELTNFFEENNIKVDYSKRGQMTVAEYKAVDMKTVLKRYTFWQKVKKAFNYFRSIW